MKGTNMTDEKKEIGQPIEIEFSEEFDCDSNHLLEIKVSSEQQEVISMIQKISGENGLKPFREDWVSKYNKAYWTDFQPFHKEGFNYRIAFEYDEPTEAKFAFTKTILGDWISKVNKLNKILALTA